MGMFASFNASYYCQHCIMHRNECRLTSIENPALRRTVEDYRLLFEDETRIFREVADAYGLRQYTYLNKIAGYNLFRNLTVDFMHDWAEGAIPDIIRKFLKMVLRLGIMQLHEINEAIIAFDFGFINSKNLPGPIDLTESLGLTASQKIVLFLHFPIIFKDLAQDARLRPYWPAVVSLVGATKICLSKVITEQDLAVLGGLIRSHLEDVINVYNCNLKPKHHFLTHYVNVIREMGPPTTMWTMR